MSACCRAMAPLACKTDRIDARVMAELSWRDLVPAIWPPDPSIRHERELARFRLHLVRHRATLKNGIHATRLGPAPAGLSQRCEFTAVLDEKQKCFASKAVLRRPPAVQR